MQEAHDSCRTTAVRQVPNQGRQLVANRRARRAGKSATPRRSAGRRTLTKSPSSSEKSFRESSRRTLAICPYCRQWPAPCGLNAAGADPAARLSGAACVDGGCCCIWLHIICMNCCMNVWNIAGGICCCVPGGGKSSPPGGPGARAWASTSACIAAYIASC